MSYGVQASYSGHPSRTPPSALEIPMAAHSRSKLQASQFSNQNERSAKAPDDLKFSGKGKPAASEQENDFSPPHATPRSQVLSQKTGGLVHNECPQTPVGRLPLAELITNGEDLNQTADFTPVERVLWGTSARTSDRGSSQETPLLLRSRKRAYSSSPASSSQKKRGLKQLTGDQVSARNYTQPHALKTPQGDPTSDLWKRYSLDIKSHEKRSPSKTNDRSFLQSMNSSSPQQPFQAFNARESAGLRRSFSCSMEWPTSAAKRRKLRHDLSHQELSACSAAAEQPVINSQKSRSRLSLLVDKIHDDLARPLVDNTNSFPTSVVRPLRSKADETIDDLSVSPKQPARQVVRTCSDIQTLENQGGNVIGMSSHLTEEEPHNSDNHSKQPEQKGTCEQETTEPGADSDFGDDDLDLEMLEALDAPVASVQPMNMKSGKPESGNGKPKLNCEGNQASNSVGHAPFLGDKNQPPAPSVIQHATIGVGQDYEFGDETNDVSAQDLEDAIALFNSQPNTGSKFKTSLREEQAVNVPPVMGIARDIQVEESNKDLVEAVMVPSGTSSDDEFGGDVEFEEMIVESDETVPRLEVISQSGSTVGLEHCPYTPKPAK